MSKTDTKDEIVQVGGNVAAVLRDYIQRIEETEAEIAGLNEDIKNYWAELKGHNLPVKGMRKILSDLRKDPEVLKENRREEALAGAILGIPVYTRTDKPVSTREYDKSTQELARQRFEAIKRLKDEIDEAKQTLRNIYLEIKGSGFSVDVVKKVVKIRKDPSAFHATTALIDTYLRAIEA